MRFIGCLYVSICMYVLQLKNPLHTKNTKLIHYIHILHNLHIYILYSILLHPLQLHTVQSDAADEQGQISAEKKEKSILPNEMNR